MPERKTTTHPQDGNHSGIVNNSSYENPYLNYRSIVGGII